MSTAVLTDVAWAYRNDVRHIGHKSGSGVASGVFARCHWTAGNRVLMVSGTDEPQGLPEADALFASGESVVSFQRPSIAGGAQPLGRRTRPADAAPEPGAAPLWLTGSLPLLLLFGGLVRPADPCLQRSGITASEVWSALVNPHLDSPGRVEWWHRCCTSLLYQGLAEAAWK